MMSDTTLTIGLFVIAAVLIGVWLSKRGENTRTVLTGPTAEAKEAERLLLADMTVKELKVFIQLKRQSLGFPADRLPTKKADLVEAALQLWVLQPW